MASASTSLPKGGKGKERVNGAIRDRAHDSATRDRAHDSLDLSNRPLPNPPPAFHSALRKLNLAASGVTSLRWVADGAPSLTLLNLSHNPGIRDWKALGRLTALFVLNVSDCRLGEVPEGVCALRSLKALVMAENSLEELRDLGDMPDLNTLVVSHNRLKRLPPSLARFKSLKKLSAAHNALTAASLPDLSVLPCLREVRLNSNSTLTSLPRHFSKWGTGKLGQVPGRGLEIVELGSCGLGDWTEAEAGIGPMPGLVNLTLRGNPLASGSDEHWDGYRSRVVAFSANLRVLDGRRLDPKSLAKVQARAATVVPTEKGPGKRGHEAVATSRAEDPFFLPSDRPGPSKRRRVPNTSAETPKQRERSPARRDIAERMRQAELDAIEDEHDEDTFHVPTAPAPVDHLAAEREDDVEGAGELVKKKTKRRTKAEARARRAAVEGAEPGPEYEGGISGPDPGSSAPAEAPPKKKRSRKKKQALKAAAASAARDSSAKELVQARDPSLYEPSLSAALAGDAAAKDATTPGEDKRKEREKAKTSVVKVIEVKRKPSPATTRDRKALEDLFSGSKEGALPPAWE